MEDRDIVVLYWQRSEDAIVQSQRKYGQLCRNLAENILTLPEDAEECVNDTWLHAWNAMPTQRPERLGAWLGRVVRNLALDRWRQSRAQKRYAGMEVLLSELEDCVSGPDTAESRAEAAEVGAAVSRWLDTLDAGDRWLFVRRYWYGEPLADLARGLELAPRVLAKRMYSLRQKLRRALEKEGIDV